MNTVFLIAAGLVLTLVLERVLYISGITAYTYYLTDRRLKGFPNYKRKWQNQLFHGKITTDKARLVPAPTPHAMVSSCIYNVNKTPIFLKAIVPDGVYWSIAFHGRNQACYFTLNDIEARNQYGQEVEVVLTKSKKFYQAVGNEIVVAAPRLSRIGLILIRTIVMDPSNPDNINQVREIQKKAFIETVA
ncbi:MAG: DUF1254 domain-containing protein [Deltaproteobacteria bacterium]|nr:DUF1254 domain-containing protein [Deltaproteobacteria bacterium]